MKKNLILISFLGFTLAFSQAQEEKKATPAQKESSREIYVQGADIQPSFPGGINVFRGNVAQNINLKKIENATGKVSSTAKFAINIEGNIESITVVGKNTDFNKQVENAIKSIKTKWKPATYKSQPVKYWFQIPFAAFID
ncbi:MAG: energy transducer TonB [Chryseobacterium sp.]|uniref:energy transducer TonB n=1 Tax=Chryseobacterium sp. TaxID=1871047 RepID=UPI001B115DF6|nr:energy transducer TonB [Chryseobacterium sp.]MBO6184957.1 energy transducer TonB [Chryseobacterium sp.]